MDLQAYQDFLVEYSDTYRLPDSIAAQTVRLGLMGESGEVIEWIKKSVRDGATDITELKAELGDMLAYLFLILRNVGICVSEISNVGYHNDIPLVRHTCIVQGSYTAQLIHFCCGKKQYRLDVYFKLLSV